MRMEVETTIKSQFRHSRNQTRKCLRRVRNTVFIVIQLERLQLWTFAEGSENVTILYISSPKERNVLDVGSKGAIELGLEKRKTIWLEGQFHCI